MDSRKNNSILQAICYIALFFILFMISFTEILPLKIGNAYPFPIIAAVITVAYYHGEWVGFYSGLTVGIFADAVTAEVIVANTLTLSVVGCLAGFLLRFYMNKNIFSAAFLSLCGAAIFFTVKWISYFTAIGFQDGLTYLLFFALPSAIYSAVFIFPLFYLGKLIKKI